MKYVTVPLASAAEASYHYGKRLLLEKEPKKQRDFLYMRGVDVTGNQFSEHQKRICVQEFTRLSLDDEGTNLNE